jgi:transposase-like protein
MSNKRRQHSDNFKFQVALEATKGLKTVNQLASEQGLHPNLISQWKRQLMADGVMIFGLGHRFGQ